MKNFLICSMIILSMVFPLGCLQSNSSTWITSDEYFAVEQIDNNKYIYSVYNKDNQLAFQGFSTKYEPSAKLVDDNLLEIKRYVGTGTWYTLYFNIETQMLSAWFECAQYLSDDTVAYFTRVEESQINLVLSNVFGKSSQVIKCDFSVSSANISDCIISVQSIGNSQIEIIYLDALGEMVTTVVNGQLQP